ncbi:MAG: hypothetical protein E4H48_09235 [Syntrophobacterales bacterium]|nr:MAG: hypothetical protein E4H48_09235 [Syntrophobacterales bacterium]
MSDRGARQAEERKATTLNDFFYDEYLEAARATKKPRTVGTEVALYEKWIKPTLGVRPVRRLVPMDFKRLQMKIIDGDLKKDPKTGKSVRVPKSPRTVHYAVSIVIQVWNAAFDAKGIVDERPPSRSSLGLVMVDNERTRAMTPEQASAFLGKMQKRSPQWHDISSLSLFAGLRASECYRLQIEHFDAQRKRIFLLTPKKQKSTYLTINDTAFRLLERLKSEHPTGKGLFFTNRKGHEITEVSDTVKRVIDSLGFNEGVTDDRDKITFHSLRHSHATWLLNSNVDIFTVNKLLRHSTLDMTKRYLHPGEERLRAAAENLDGSLPFSDVQNDVPAKGQKGKG